MNKFPVYFSDYTSVMVYIMLGVFYNGFLLKFVGSVTKKNFLCSHDV